jgi:hypothetical protein
MRSPRPLTASAGDEDTSSVMPCCRDRAHAWDEFRVGTDWLPDRVRCLIVGENPGSTSTAYFYDGARRVAVRTILLRELHGAGIVTSPTLEAFRAAGLLFDHGIRCRLADAEVATQRRLAREYLSPRANAATHLTPLIRDASGVWVMGYVARNAVAAAWSEFPRDTRDISRCPYPRQLPEAPRFFISRYLTRAPREEVATIVREFVSFWATIEEDDRGSSNSTVQQTGGSRCSPPGC